MNFWMGQTVLGLLVPFGTLGPFSGPTNVSTVDSCFPTGRRIRAKPRQSSIGASGCQTTYVWSQFAYATILIIGGDLATSSRTQPVSPPLKVGLIGNACTTLGGDSALVSVRCQENKIFARGGFGWQELSFCRIGCRWGARRGNLQ